MEQKFYPLLFKIADTKSKKSQNIFIRLNIFILLLLILSSVSSIYTTVPKNITTFSTICLILSTLLNIYILLFSIINLSLMISQVPPIHSAIGNSSVNS